MLGGLAVDILTREKTKFISAYIRSLFLLTSSVLGDKSLKSQRWDRKWGWFGLE